LKAFEERACLTQARAPLFVDGEEAARSVGEGGETMMRKLVERNVKGLESNVELELRVISVAVARRQGGRPASGGDDETV
jgi:hypothetical protein